MKRKRFIKIAMAAGHSRNKATDMADRCTGVNRLVTAYGLRMYIGIDQAMRRVQKEVMKADYASRPYMFGFDVGQGSDFTATHQLRLYSALQSLPTSK